MALPVPDPDPDHWISVLRASHDRLAALVSGLGPDDLRRGSGSSEWSVAQVLSHLGSGAEIALGGLQAALAGQDAPGRDAAAPIWDRWNAKTPDAMAADAIVSDRAHVDALEGLDPTTRKEARIKLAFLPAPIDVATLTGFRLSEHALHTWDVAVAFDPAATVAEDAATLLIDRVPLMTAWIAKPAALGRSQEDPLRVALLTSSPDRRYLLVAGSAVGLEELADGGEPQGTVRMSGEALLRLSAGRLPPKWTPPSVEVQGQASLDDLRSLFPGM